MQNLINDLSTLTNIPLDIWEKFVNIAEMDIAHCAFETISSKEKSFSIDIGLGILYIKYEEDNIKYKFIPHESLEREVENALTCKSSPLVDIATKKLNTRLNNAYKEFI
jgi:hypothetical protein